MGGPCGMCGQLIKEILFCGIVRLERVAGGSGLQQLDKPLLQCIRIYHDV